MEQYIAVRPVLEFSSVSTDSSTYQELVKYMPKSGLLGEIEEFGISCDTAGIATAQFKVIINTQERFKDIVLPSTSVQNFKFARELKLDAHYNQGIIIYCRGNGTTVRCNAKITGVEKELRNVGD